jgi:di/tricarboxylate transporter
VTPEIALVLAILAGALICFVTGILRVDVTALLVLLTLALTGLVTPAQAVAGFSNPAVVTIAGMFVISAALSRTGVASIVGRRIYSASAGRPHRLVAVTMLVAGVMSAFINSVGLTAMMLPVVMDLARRSRVAPSKLLLPLVMGALLGSTTSLVGTPRNIVASAALDQAGYDAFRVFDFAPVGLVILVSGVAFMSLIGWRLLPVRDTQRADAQDRDENLAASFDLRERLFVVRVPARSPLDGKPLAESRLGSALGLHVVAIMRHGEEILAPGPATLLHSHDRLLVEGRPELLREIQGNRHLRLHEVDGIEQRLSEAEFALAEARVSAASSLVGKTVWDADLRGRLSVATLAILRDGVPRLTGLHDTVLAAGDTLLVQGMQPQLQSLESNPDFEGCTPVSVADAFRNYRIHERLVALQVTSGSMLINRSLGETRLADAAGLTIIAIIRSDRMILMPQAGETFSEDDLLVVTANPEDLRVLRALQKLEMDEGPIPELSRLETDRVGLLEVVLAPRATIVGRTLRQLHFREKYGLSVLAIWREGRPIRTNLRDVPLRFGDALLVFGPRARLRVLASEPEFISLTQAVQSEPRTNMAPLALLGLAVALVPAMLGWLEISVSVLMGATLVVIAGVLTPDEAYRGIELQAVVLVAALVPLQVALTNTDAAGFIADFMLGLFEPMGPRGVLAALAIMTALGSQAVPAPALVVLMAPVAITVAQTAGLSPHALMMGVALSASGLASPVGHPANALIMGPAGYRYIDYLKVGLPLTILCLLIVIFVMPAVWPL